MDFVYCSINIFLLCFVVSIAIARSAAHVNRFRSIGGRDARPGEFPYVLRVERRSSLLAASGATLERQHQHVCTAAALTRTAALTAAHCCPPPLQLAVTIANGHRLEQTWVLRYGSASSRPTEDDSFGDVLECLLPPSARSLQHPLMVDDVALMRTQAILLSAYARLSALDYRTALGQHVRVLGYGNTNSSSGELHDTLELGMPLQVVNAMWAKCEEPMYPFVCGVEACGQHAAICQGDSGGPAVHASGVIGISSRSLVEYSCQMRTDATRYASMVYMVPLSSYINWIADTIASMSTY